MKKLTISYKLEGKEYPVYGVIGNDSTIIDIMRKKITKLICKGFKVIGMNNTSIIYASDEVYTQYKFTVTE